MIQVNVVYDEILDDSDIIAIPNEIAFKIEIISQEFLKWITSTENSEYWTVINGQKLLVAETDGFVNWLNSTYCKGTKKAYIVERKTNYNPLLKTIDF